MGKLLHAICCVAFVGLMASNLSADVFSDNFEAGNLNLWTQARTDGYYVTISNAQNIVPAGGTYSALIDDSRDRVYRNLGSEVSGHALLTFYLFDDTATRAFTQITGYAGAGYNDGALQQLLAIGKYNDTTMPGESDAEIGLWYQGRLAFGTTAGWFNLNGAGSAGRSAGWHRFDIEVLPSGSDVNFYVDGVPSRSFSGATVATYDSIAFGLNAGTSAGNAYFDGFSVSVVPEPGSVAILVSGLVALAGLALVRVRRRSA